MRVRPDNLRKGWLRKAGLVVLPAVMAVMLSSAKPAEAALVGYNWEATLTSGNDFLGDSVTFGDTVTGTLVFDDASTDTDSVPFFYYLWEDSTPPPTPQPLGASSVLTVTYNGRTFATAVGGLEAAAINFGSPNGIFFGVDVDPGGPMPGSGAFYETTGGSPVLIDSDAQFSLGMGRAAPFGPDALSATDFIGTTWGAGIFGDLAIQFVGGNNDELIAAGVNFTSSFEPEGGGGGGASTPEPVAAVMAVLALAGVFVLGRRRRRIRST